MKHSFSPRSKLYLGATSVALALLLAAPLALSQDDRFGDSTDVVLVQIPVYATRDGKPVLGLTAKNFEVLEGKKKQEIVAVDVFDLTLDAPSSSESGPLANQVPAAGRRYFIMLFDLSNSDPAGIVRAREAALDLARTGLHPSDLASVATYSQQHGINLLLGFSTDRVQLEAALNDLGLADPFDSPNDPLKLMIAEVEDDIRMGGGGRFAETYLQNLKDMSTLTGRSTRDQIKQQIIDLSSNLDELAKLLDTASGRKQIVLFSQGFNSEIVFGTTDQQRLQEMTQEIDLGRIWRVDSDERFGSGDAQRSLLYMLEDFNRSDCAIHTVDVGGLAAGGSADTVRASGRDFGTNTRLDQGHDGLALMANETGGEFYRNLNDLTDAMDDLLERTSVTYVVSIRPREVLADGAYHPLKVRLKGVEKGIKLSHRPGYYARRPYSELDAVERQLSSAELVVAGSPGGQISTNVLAAAFPGRNSGSYVLTALEIDGTTLLANQPDNVVPTEIYTYAFDEQGQVRDFYSQAVMLDLYKVGYRMQRGFKLLSHLELPEGRYEIRSLVRNARTGASGLAVSKVEVPRFDASTPIILPPFFIEPDDHWLVGHEERDEDSTSPYPLMGRDKPMVPATHPQLVSGQPIPVLLVGHFLPDTLQAEGHLIGPNGKRQNKVDIEIERRSPGRNGSERLMAKLVASAVDPGEYRLIVTVRGEGLEASNSIPVSFPQ